MRFLADDSRSVREGKPVVRSAVLHEFGASHAGLRVEELPVLDEPGAGQVLIDVAACGVNFPDLLVVEGSYQSLPPLPFTPGKELAGTVRAVGAGVTRFVPGSRVMAQIEHGAFRAEVLVEEDRCFPIPDSMPFDEAAAFGLVYATAYMALVRRAHLQAGETVLVTAASGSVGSAAVQLASALGAHTIAVVRDASAIARATADGADDIVHLSDASELRDAVRAATDGRGADVVIEAVGGDLFAACLRATAWEGRIVSVGYASLDVPTIKAGHLLVKNIGVMGLQISDYQSREPASIAAAYEHILRLRDAGQVTIRIAHRFPLEDTGLALGAVAAGGLDGRVVLILGDR
jgi:NADPH:quinone reductase-like Zn-dependent oxidoreductase